MNPIALPSLTNVKMRNFRAEIKLPLELFLCLLDHVNANVLVVWLIVQQ